MAAVKSERDGGGETEGIDGAAAFGSGGAATGAAPIDGDGARCGAAAAKSERGGGRATLGAGRAAELEAVARSERGPPADVWVCFVAPLAGASAVTGRADISAALAAAAP